MNWDDLRVFLALSRASTLSGAAAALGIDATTVGRRLRRLEAGMNASLFEPEATGQALTEHGRRLLAHAEAVERATGAAREEIAGERAQLAGAVRVSIAEGLGTWLVARNLAAFHTANPHIELELVATNGFLNPSKREADLAIMLAPPTRGPLIARRLTDYSLKLYASAAYLEEHGAPRSLRHLRRHTLIGYISDFIYAEELRYLAEVERDLEPGLTSSSINVQHAMISAAAGIGVLPCFIGDQDATLSRVLDQEVTITRSFWLVVHRDVRSLARVTAVIDWLDELTQKSRSLLTGAATGAGIRAGDGA